MSIYIKEIYSIDIMFIPHIILNQKKATLLASTKKHMFRFTHLFQSKKNTTGAIFASDKGTWFHWVAESIQVPLWWDYLMCWSTFSYKFFWKVGGGVWFTPPPFFQEKKMFFFCKNAKKNECESHRLLWGRRDGSKNEPWMLELNFAFFFFGWPVAPSGYIKKEWRSRVVYSFPKRWFTANDVGLWKKNHLKQSSVSLTRELHKSISKQKHMSRVNASWSPNKHLEIGNTKLISRYQQRKFSGLELQLELFCNSII